MSGNFVEWSKEFSTGIVKIDNQHKNLLNMTNNLFNASKLGEIKATEIFEETMKGLVDYVKFHFKTEEELFLKYDYPSYIEHKEEHDKFTLKVLDMLSSFDNGKKALIIDITKFLKEWIYKHIAISDKEYSNFLNEKMKEDESKTKEAVL